MLNLTHTSTEVTPARSDTATQYPLNLSKLARSATVLAWASPVIATSSLPVHAKTTTQMQLASDLVNPTVSAQQQETGYAETQEIAELVIDEIPAELEHLMNPSPRAHSYMTLSASEYTSGSSDAPTFSSNPGSQHVLYIDFDGEAVHNRFVAENYGEYINVEAFSLDADHTYFSGEEITYIEEVWQVVSEDFSIFDVNVTTDRNVYDATDMHKRAMVIATPSCEWLGRCHVYGLSGDNFGSLKYDFTGQEYRPGFLIQRPHWPAYFAGNIISHEFGHVFGLDHDGLESPKRTYYNGTDGWGPIMGVASLSRHATWSQGEYSSATNTEDDIARIAMRLGYREDEATRYGDGHFNGVISSLEYDDFIVEAKLGDTIDASISVPPHGYNNLKARIQVFDPYGALVAVQEPDFYTINTDMPETVLSYSALIDGEYTIRIDGFGATAPYLIHQYGSAGQYAIDINHTKVNPSDAHSESVSDNTLNVNQEVDASPAVNPASSADTETEKNVSADISSESVQESNIAVVTKPVVAPSASKDSSSHDVQQIIRAVVEMVRNEILSK